MLGPADEAVQDEDENRAGGTIACQSVVRLSVKFKDEPTFLLGLQHQNRHRLLHGWPYLRPCVGNPR
jgi:hypothetical protein